MPRDHERVWVTWRANPDGAKYSIDNYGEFDAVYAGTSFVVAGSRMI